MQRKQNGLVPIGEAYGRSWSTTALSRRTVFLASV